MELFKNLSFLDFEFITGTKLDKKFIFYSMKSVEKPQSIIAKLLITKKCYFPYSFFQCVFHVSAQDAVDAERQSEGRKVVFNALLCCLS